jgi:cell wall assembly regulator SMI1
MQKFTRPLSREIEVAGERLALTLDAQGLTVRLVGSRKATHEMTWAEWICRLTARPAGAAPPTPEEVARAIDLIRKGAAPKTSGESTSSPPASRMAGLVGRLEKWLAQHRHHYLEGLRPGASQADLEALQRSLGVPLPEDLQALLAWHNGQKEDTLGRFEQDWIFLGAEEIAAAKKDLDGDADAKGKGWQRAWIPILDNDAGDYVCLDTSQPEAQVREFWQDRTDHPVVAPSLASWFEEMVNAVERGDYHEDPERGSFLKST